MKSSFDKSVVVVISITASGAFSALTKYEIFLAPERSIQTSFPVIGEVNCSCKILDDVILCAIAQKGISSLAHELLLLGKCNGVVEIEQVALEISTIDVVN